MFPKSRAWSPATGQQHRPRQIGSLIVDFPIGLGCASLSGSYGYADERSALTVIDLAIDRGVTLFDTSDKYGAGHNEELIGRAIAGRRSKVLIASKFGNLAGKGGKIADGRPETVIRSCEASLRRLGVEVIDLYLQHRVDPSVPIEETVGAMASLVNQGKVRTIGLCEAGPTTVRRAHRVHPISAVQTEYSILYRTEAEDVLKACREIGASLIAYAPLGRGLLTGTLTPATISDSDSRLRHPRFKPENLSHNLNLVKSLQTIASNRNCTAGQIALAWLLAQGDDLIPIPGTKSPDRLAENVDSAYITLTPDEVTFLSQAFPPGAAAGLRYRSEHMKNMNI